MSVTRRWPGSQRTTNRAGGFCRWLRPGVEWRGAPRRRSAGWIARLCATTSAGKLQMATSNECADLIEMREDEFSSRIAVLRAQRTLLTDYGAVGARCDLAAPCSRSKGWSYRALRILWPASIIRHDESLVDAARPRFGLDASNGRGSPQSATRWRRQALGNQCSGDLPE
jgi:hypothetical protein